jgi:hypothetical protein
MQREGSMDKLPGMSVVSLGPASNGMNTSALPALVAAAGERASMRFLEFFAANICNPHTAGPTPAPPMNSLPGARPPACGRPAGARRHLDRDRHPRARGTERQTTARGDPSLVRLARHRPGRAGQPGRVGAVPRHVVTCGQTPVLDDMMAAKSWIRVLSGSPTTPGRQRHHRTQHPSIPVMGRKFTFDPQIKE